MATETAVITTLDELWSGIPPYLRIKHSMTPFQVRKTMTLNMAVVVHGGRVVEWRRPQIGRCKERETLRHRQSRWPFYRHTMIDRPRWREGLETRLERSDMQAAGSLPNFRR
jgi:hypothetical protein